MRWYSKFRIKSIWLYMMNNIEKDFKFTIIIFFEMQIHLTFQINYSSKTIYQNTFLSINTNQIVLQNLKLPSFNSNLSLGCVWYERRYFSCKVLFWIIISSIINNFCCLFFSVTNKLRKHILNIFICNLGNYYDE